MEAAFEYRSVWLHSHGLLASLSRMGFPVPLVCAGEGCVLQFPSTHSALLAWLGG